MDAEGRRVVPRERRSRKLALVVAVQNLLVAACLVATLYVYREVRAPEEEENVHIKFGSLSDIRGNVTLQFKAIDSSYKMSLVGEKNEMISINCTGPYVLYIDVCYITLMSRPETGGELLLQVAGTKTPAGSLILPPSREDCRELHSIVYLKANQEASLHLYCNPDFKVKNVSVTLSYLLGRFCEY